VVVTLASATPTTPTPPPAPTPKPTPPAAGVPAKPTNLGVSVGNRVVNLTWTGSSGATNYRVKRSSSNGGAFTQVGNPTGTSYSDTTVSGGSTYFYVVTAVNSAGESANSGQVVGAPWGSSTPTTPTTPTVPTPPATTTPPPVVVPSVPLNVQAVAGDKQVVVLWGPSSTATSYQVKRSTSNGGPYTQVATTSALTYTDTAVTNGMNYFYVVVAVSAVGSSASSAQVTAQPTAPVQTPVTVGTWINVTPSNASAAGSFGCGNYGTETVQADPANPGHVYTQFNCQGIWKSTDYGATWTGPINKGSNGAAVGDCAGGISISQTSTSAVPTIYQACIRGNGMGFWRSTDGGVNWTRYNVAPGGGRQDYYPPAIDPYDVNHLLMAGHEMNSLVESTNGGQTWTAVPLEGGMNQQGGTASVFFINTGNATTTRKTWLYLGQMTGGNIGTWRTSNGVNWTKVERNEHPHGSSQIYQPDNSGVVYMAGMYSSLGWGVLRSTDYGQTWAKVGPNANETVVTGTSKNLYTMYGWPQGAGQVHNPAFMVGAQPGTGAWVTPATPAGLTQGAAWIQVMNNGSRNILIGAMWNAGLWRYIEP
jgi:hypothetical protein